MASQDWVTRHNVECIVAGHAVLWQPKNNPGHVTHWAYGDSLSGWCGVQGCCPRPSPAEAIGLLTGLAAHLPKKDARKLNQRIAVFNDMWKWVPSEVLAPG